MSHDVRFALMAVVPDARESLTRRLTLLRTNREIVIVALRQLLTLYQERKVVRSRVKQEPVEVKEEPQSEPEEEVMVVGDSSTTPEAAKLAQEVISALKDDTELVKEMSNSVMAGIVVAVEAPGVVEETPEAPSDPTPVSSKSSSPPGEDYTDPSSKPSKSHVSKVISRCSSIDSQQSQQPRSPFQSNPLLTAHDYAKSPLMEGLEEESNCDSLDRGDDSNDGSNIDSENIDSVDSLGPSDSASERVDSSVGGVILGEEGERGPTPVEDVEEEGKEPKDVTGETIGDDMQSRRSDIDDDEAMSVEDIDTSEQKKEATAEPAGFDPQAAELQEPHSFSPRDLLSILRSVETSIHNTEVKMRDEGEKRKKYRIDDCRRVHNYDEFLTTFLAMLTERNLLGDLMEHSLGRGQPGGQEAGKEQGGKGTKKEPEKEPTSSATKQGKKVMAKVGPKTNLKHLTKTKLTKKRRQLSESDGTDSTDSLVNPPPPIMYSDPSLPPGWKRKVKKRAGLGVGVQGKWDVFIVNPDGRKFKSKTELRNYIDRQSDSELDVDNFDFTVSGIRRGNIKFTARKKKLMEKKKHD